MSEICHSCGTSIVEGEEFEYMGDYYCPECRDEYFVICDRCGAEHHVYDSTDYGGDAYCLSCRDEVLVTCDSCGELHHEDDTFEYGGDYYCPSCRRDQFTTCDHCQNLVHEEDVIADDTTVLCQRCFDRHYNRCSRCETIIYEDYTFWIEDDPYCEDCAREMEDTFTIHEYGFDPYPLFHGEGPLYMGVELEVDKGGEDRNNARTILDIANKFENNVYIKRDGSLDDGFEIVSHPCSYEYHLNELPWEEMMEELKEMGYRSHDAGTCGLHVHVNRDFFGESTIYQDAGIAKLLYLHEKFWDEILRFSRRTESQVDRYCKRYGMYKDENELLEVAKGSHRYFAINLNNSSTVEFRIFRGTLRYSTFIATLQFVKHMVEVSVVLSIDEIKRITWDQFIKAGSKYKELMSYVKEKGLLPAEMEEEVGEIQYDGLVEV